MAVNLAPDHVPSEIMFIYIVQVVHINLNGWNNLGISIEKKMVFVKDNSIRNYGLKKELIFLFFPVIFMLVLLVRICKLPNVLSACTLLIDLIQMVVYKLVCMQCTTFQILLYRSRYNEKSPKSCDEVVAEEFTC